MHSASEVTPLQAPDLALLGRLVQFSARDRSLLLELWSLIYRRTDEYLDILLGLLAGNAGLRSLFANHDLKSPEFLISLRAEVQHWVERGCEQPDEPDWVCHLYDRLAREDREAALSPPRLAVALVMPLADALDIMLSNELGEPRLRDLRHAWIKVLLWQAAILHELHLRHQLAHSLEGDSNSG